MGAKWDYKIAIQDIYGMCSIARNDGTRENKVSNREPPETNELIAV